jgi:hypothetical protein
MNDHVPDAGKMVCPKCGAALLRESEGLIQFMCGSMAKPGYMGLKIETAICTGSERDQLRARVEELEGWIRSLETHPDSDGHHKSIDPDWQWVAKGRQIYVGTPKPEELR